MRERSNWARQGLLLWALQRPYLRYLPLPYPSTASVERWEAQGRVLCMDKVMAKRHFDKAVKSNGFNYENLREMIHLRNRLGLEVAFCEDPVVHGFKMAKAAKGLNQKVKEAAMAEAKEKAKIAKEEGNQKELARALIGPRGGLPSLRADLVKLAALLNVPLEPKDTVEIIKAKIKPMMEVLKEEPKPVASAAGKAKAKSKAASQSSRDPQWLDCSTASNQQLMYTPPPNRMVPIEQFMEMKARFQTTLDHMALDCLCM